MRDLLTGHKIHSNHPPVRSNPKQKHDWEAGNVNAPERGPQYARCNYTQLIKIDKI